MASALGFWFETGLGYYANFVLPVIGTIVDTNWLGNALGPEFTGLMWTKKLLGICWEDTKGFTWIENKLNKAFNRITSELNAKTEAKTMNDIDLPREGDTKEVQEIMGGGEAGGGEQHQQHVRTVYVQGSRTLSAGYGKPT